jgi:hypothetical protein
LRKRKKSMSTKSSIKARHSTSEQPGFHLYTDVLDSLDVRDGAPEPPVYLRLDGVAAQLETLNSGGATVTVVLPRGMARELGLLPLEDGVA